MPRAILSGILRALSIFAATGVDVDLDAPKGALMLREGASQHEWFWSFNCNAGMATFRQKLAFVSQADTEVTAACEDWSPYDWIWMVNKGEMALFDRPPLPLVLYCHDMWRGNKQEALDHFQPEVILTPFPTPWRQNLRIPDASKVVFTPACPAPFFARPNLDPAKKKWDLLVIGALGSDFYVPRRALNAQLEELPDRFKVWHSHEVGSKRARWFGPLDDDTHCYMNKWSAKLGAAKFVIFGPCAGRAKEMLLIKYYECLASGAVPILPEVRDLEYIGVQPMVHYIPFHLVDGNNRVLAYLLDYYENFQYIAKSAVKWYEENAHRLVFESFQNVIEFVTNGKYPKRLL